VAAKRSRRSTLKLPSNFDGGGQQEEGSRRSEVGGCRTKDENEDYGSRKRIDLIEQIAVNEP